MTENPKLSAVQTSAGKGTRIRPLNMVSESQTFPKGLIRVMGVPIAELQMEELKAGGITDLYIITQFLENRHFLSERFGDGKRFGMDIRYSYPKDDDQNNGSGDAILRNIEKKNIPGHSIVLANDNLYEYDSSNVVKRHLESDALMSIMTVRVLPTSTIQTYGIIETDENKRVLRLVEKPKTIEDLKKFLNVQEESQLHSSTVKINTAGYVLNNEKLRSLAAQEDWIKAGRSKNSGREFDMAGDLITGLVQRGHPIYTIPIDKWGDFGSASFFLETFPKVLEGAFPSVYGILESQGYIHDTKRNTWIHPTTMHLVDSKGATLEEKMKSGSVKIGPNVFIGRDTTIGENVEIRYSNLEKYSVVDSGSRVEHSYFSPFCQVGESAKIMSSALGHGVKVRSSAENETHIDGKCIVGADLIVPAGTKLYQTKIFPGFHFNEAGQTYKDVELKPEK